MGTAFGRTALTLAVTALLGTALLTAIAPFESKGVVAYGCLCVAIVVAIMLRVTGVVDSISASPILGFIPWLAVTWPVTVIFFAIVSPDATYPTLFGPVPFLLRAEVLLFAVLLFLGGYCAGISPILLGRQRPTPISPDGHRTNAEWWLIAVGAIVITMGWVASLAGIQGQVRFIADGLRNYLTGFVFAAGYRWKTLSQSQRLSIALTVVANGIVYTIANGRGIAALPVLLVLGGYLISPQTTRRLRIILVASALVGLPVYAVVGNQTRTELGSIGFQDFDQRASVLKDALSGNIVFEEGGGFLEDTMSRLFSAGGHALLAANWDRMRIQDFDLALFGIEFAETMLPAYLFGSKDSQRYVGSRILREYGFMITEETSVEVSLIGSLCAAGGPVLVVVGGLVLGLFHLTLVRAIGRFRPRPWAVPFAGCMFFIGMMVHTLDLIQLLRFYFWAILYLGIAMQACVLLERLIFGVRVAVEGRPINASIPPEARADR